MKFLARIIVWPLGLVLSVLLAYTAAAVMSALIPIDGRPQMLSGTELPVYACVTDVHADFALPLDDPQTDWRTELGPSLPQGLPPGTYLLLGWGDAVFFRDVLQMSDLTPERAATALAGRHPAVVRLVPIARPSGGGECQPLPLDDEGRLALAFHILDSLDRKTDGALTELPTHVEGETLLLAKGHWGAFNTCNQWASRALGAAGLPHAAFAPFSFGVTWPLKHAITGEIEDNDQP